MKFHYRYIFLSFMAATIVFLIVVLIYGAQKKEGDDTKYLTWEVPGFAYINNQMILHVASELYNPTNRKVVHPKLWFPSIYNTQNKYVGINELYEEKFENLTDETYKDVDTVSEAQSSDDNYIRINNSRESYWSYMYPRFIIYTFVIGGNWRKQAHSIMNRYQYKKGGIINKCIEMAKEQYPIKESIGIHLRTWNKDVSLVNSHECDKIYHNNPLKLLWSCKLDENNVSNMIDWLSNDKDTPILVATDDSHSSLISNLKSKYSKLYLINYDKLLNQCFNETKEFDQKWMKVHGLAIIDNELLANTGQFIGNLFSTFSDIVAIKRENNSYFVQNTHQYLLEHYLFLWVFLILCLIFSPFVFLIYHLINKKL
ncbi:hypothetical protein K502DRAFT_354300 [Neoconidiobolus thromboides FSU 785]|nr:hypothetical protein K502DRAFT_354300 [Neoconidiobolus thromboides FSU 785]